MIRGKRLSLAKNVVVKVMSRLSTSVQGNMNKTHEGRRKSLQGSEVVFRTSVLISASGLAVLKGYEAR